MAQPDLSGATILLVDDLPDNLRVLRQALEPEGFSLMVATSGQAALEIARNAHPDLILLDVLMPGVDGFETCRQLKADPATQHIPVIFITARAETEAVVEGFRVGSVDYIVKPFQNEEVLARVRTHLENDRLRREVVLKNEQLEAEIAQRKAISEERNQLEEHLSVLHNREDERWGVAGFVGESKTIRLVLENIGRLQGTGATVLITGESGTGKELVARAIHHGSPQAQAPFVAVNCSAIPGELAESTLFGHIRGAFTGADRDRVGYFQLANKGTLFLDEIGDMSPDIQGKLLRILEDGLVQPVGAASGTHVDVRVIAATNRDLQPAFATGAFRQDLYFRLARFPVHVPPLRDRKEDVPLLAQHFLRILAAEMGGEPPPLAADILGHLADYDYPGNVRELKNIVEHALIMAGGKSLRPEHLNFLSLSTPSSSQSDAIPLNLKEAEEMLIQRAIDKARGNIAEAARQLGVSRTTVYRYLDDHSEQAGR